MAWWRLSLLLVLAGCAHAPTEPQLTGPTLELRLDDSHAAEKLPLPERVSELILRFDPLLDSYIPLQLKLLLAAPGRVVLSVYRTSPEGNLGALVERIERNYPAALVSNGHDGRWVVERLSIPVEHGPLWIGFADGNGQLWASSQDSSWVFQRDRDPSVALYSRRVTKTPMVRLEVAPAMPR